MEALQWQCQANMFGKGIFGSHVRPHLQLDDIGVQVARAVRQQPPQHCSTVQVLPLEEPDGAALACPDVERQLREAGAGLPAADGGMCTALNSSEKGKQTTDAHGCGVRGVWCISRGAAPSDLVSTPAINGNQCFELLQMLDLAQDTGVPAAEADIAAQDIVTPCAAMRMPRSRGFPL